jgi:hypothetical protein
MPTLHVHSGSPSGPVEQLAAGTHGLRAHGSKVRKREARSPTRSRGGTGNDGEAAAAAAAAAVATSEKEAIHDAGEEVTEVTPGRRLATGGLGWAPAMFRLEITEPLRS